MMIELIAAMQLNGCISNEYGRIGVLVSKYGHRISKVYKHSPAMTSGLITGDVILECDGQTSNNYIDGIAKTVAHLKIQRGDKTLYFEVPRVAKREVYD